MAAPEKSSLRKRARARRGEVDPAVREAQQPAWTTQVLGLDAMTGARVVAAYVSYGTEPPTGDLIDALRERGVRVLLPVLLADSDLDWSEDGTALGVDAVAQADVVVVPALLVATDGARLGQGGGSYDRALTRLRPGTPVVALLHEHELVAPGVVPREPHDVAVTHAATPTRLVALEPSGNRDSRRGSGQTDEPSA